MPAKYRLTHGETPALKGPTPGLPPRPTGYPPRLSCYDRDGTRRSAMLLMPSHFNTSLNACGRSNPLIVAA